MEKKAVNITYHASEYLTMGTEYTDILKGVVDGVHARLGNKYNLEFTVSYQDTNGDILGIRDLDKDRAKEAMNLFEEGAGTIRQKCASN